MSRTIANGLVVLFEGIDGIGKSTQLQQALQALQTDDWQVAASRNLGGSPFGEQLREVLLSPTERPPLAELHVSAAIQWALAEVVTQHREAGDVLLIDRSPLSLGAYNIYGSGVDPEIGWPYVESGMDQLRPDLVILYEGDIANAIERARASAGEIDYYESKSFEYFERVVEGYQEAKRRFGTLIQVVNADQPIADVHRQTMTLIQKALDTAISTTSQA